jgi:hypothetical protein
VHIKSIFSRSSYLAFGFLLFIFFILPSTAAATKSKDWAVYPCEDNTNQPLKVTVHLALLPDQTIKNLSVILNLDGSRVKKHNSGKSYISSSRAHNIQTVFWRNLPAGTQTSKTETFNPPIFDTKVGCVHKVVLDKIEHTDEGPNVRGTQHSFNTSVRKEMGSIDNIKARTMKSCTIRLKQTGHHSDGWKVITANCVSGRAKDN